MGTEFTIGPSALRLSAHTQAAISTDVSDWRMRLRDMSSQQVSLEELIPGVEQVMERTAREVKESLNRIQAREREFNHDLEDGASQYRQEQDVRAPATVPRALLPRGAA